MVLSPKIEVRNTFAEYSNEPSIVGMEKGNVETLLKRAVCQHGRSRGLTISSGGHSWHSYTSRDA